MTDTIPTQPKQIGQIFGKIQQIMKELDAVGKDDYNEHQKFKFRSIDAVYNELHGRLADHGVFTVPRIVAVKKEEQKTKNGSMMNATIEVDYIFFAQDGSNVVARVLGEGSDYGDKASSKAMAIAHKYALLQVFCIPTQDEKDPDGQSPGAPKASAPKSALPKAKSDAVQDYVVGCGKKYYGQTLADVGLKEAQEYASYLERGATESNKPLTGKFLEFVKKVEQWTDQTYVKGDASSGDESDDVPW